MCFFLLSVHSQIIDSGAASGSAEGETVCCHNRIHTFQGELDQNIIFQSSGIYSPRKGRSMRFPAGGFKESLMTKRKSLVRSIKLIVRRVRKSQVLLAKCHARRSGKVFHNRLSTCRVSTWKSNSNFSTAPSRHPSRTKSSRKVRGMPAALLVCVCEFRGKTNMLETSHFSGGRKIGEVFLVQLRESKRFPMSHFCPRLKFFIRSPVGLTESSQLQLISRLSRY